MASEHDLAEASDETLLELRLCDLRLRLEGSLLEAPIVRLREELDARGFDFRPHIWLSSEWFTPDGVTGFAAPFYLAHPRLLELERAQLGAVEGEDEEECLRLLRHEAAHAFLNAYRLHRRRAWRETFGYASTPYRRRWRPDPTSEDHVRHIGGWYAQSHPVEDFCETFAVWLQPEAQWERRYACWPALEKLKWVDAEMERIRDLPPLLIERERTEALPTLRTKLATHYRAKRKRYAGAASEPEDRVLDALFTGEEGRKSVSAASWLAAKERSLLRAARAGGFDLYTAQQVLDRWIHRARGRELRKNPPTLETARRALHQAIRDLVAGHDTPEFTR